MEKERNECKKSASNGHRELGNTYIEQDQVVMQVLPVWLHSVYIGIR